MAKWATPGAWVSNTITLNSLATGSTALATTDVTNGTSLELYADVSLLLGSITPGTSPFVELHLRALAHDGSSFADVVLGPPTLVGASAVAAGASAKVLVFAGILLPPGTFRWAVVNRTGTAFAASGNALQHRLYSAA